MPCPCSDPLKKEIERIKQLEQQKEIERQKNKVSLPIRKNKFRRNKINK